MINNRFIKMTFHLNKYLILTFIFLLSSIILAQSYQIRFEHITTDDGLSSNRISHIFQDRKGFLWISTEDGINRYDGYNFKQFRQITGNLNSISDFAVEYIFEDSKGLFWISTREGLDLFDPVKEIFTHFKPIKNDTTSLSSEKITVIGEDKFGKIWVGTRKGLNLFDPVKSTFRHFTNDEKNKKSLSSNYITAIYLDSYGNLWIGTRNGLNKFDYKTEQFDIYLPEQNNSKSIVGKGISCIIEDENKNLWVGTTSGLSKLTLKDNNIIQFENYVSDPVDSNSLSSNNIRVIAEDKSGKLWIGTSNEGVCVFNKEKKLFKRIQYSEENVYSINENRIYAICIDDFDNIWIGTLSSGLNKYNPSKERFGLFQPVPNSKKDVPGNNISSILLDNTRNLWLGTTGAGIFVYSLNSYSEPGKLLFVLNTRSSPALSNDYAMSMIQDRSGKIWIGTFGGGLNSYEPGTKEIKVYKNNPDDSVSLSANYIHMVYEDSQGFIWIGTGLGGLNKFDKNTKSFEHFTNSLNMVDNPKYLNSFEVSSILEDDIDHLWIGTTIGGSSRFNKKNKLFEHFRHHQEDGNSIGSNRVNCIYKDKEQRLWFGTFSGGLNLYNEKTSSFTKILISDGLPSNIIESIIEDFDADIWLGTANGISRYNPKSKNIRNFDISDGLQGKESYENSIVRDEKTGSLFFGGANGLNIYHPGSIKENETPPQIVITDFKLFNKSVTVSESSVLTEAFPYTKEIVIDYDQNVFSFEFAALDYTDPQKNEYAYKLEGFDKDWVNSGKKREATYTNLSPGSYVFKVKGTNSDGVWNEKGTSLSLIINPPLWRTWWAYTIYVVLIVTGFFTVRKYELNRIKLRNDLKLKEFESKKLQEVDQLKSRFFANISHEFRTPLTIILGSLEKLKAKIESSDNEKEISIMKRNASRLLQLINQLLELSRIESGSIQLRASEYDVVKFAKRIIASFSSLAHQKNLSLTFNSTNIESTTINEKTQIYFDTKKLETAFYNLLSNAVKFTPAGEKIDVSISKEDRFVIIVFLNTGVEIPSENVEKIFDRFYQVDDSGTRNFEGTGIGLSLVKEYIELHKGKIEVESKNHMTTFTVYLPIGKSHLKEDQIIPYENLDVETIEKYHKEKVSFTASEISDNEVIEPDKTIILVVEDNPDLREMIKEYLQDDFSVLEAENGIEGMKLADKTIPDLIISDIMMPEMDGYELTRKIKSNEKTNHIPVVLLTAKAATEDKLEGLETGADDYLIKPFNEKELIIRVKNLIKIRKQMREKYQSEYLIKPVDVVVPSTQKVFLEKLIRIIEENLSNDQFSVEVLCNEIGMSRTQLHRKVKSVTNQSTTEFIRNYRLQSAAQLLKQDAGNIAEISNKVGFSSQAYFTKLFQELYGQTPLDFKKQHEE